jgi:hypothetical protein
MGNETNEDITTKFEADLPHCVRNVKEINVPLFKFCYNIFIGVTIIKEMPGSVASVTLCIACHFPPYRMECLASNVIKVNVMVTFMCTFVRFINLSKIELRSPLLESRVEWGRIRGPAAPMHLGRTNGPFVHSF